MIQAIERASVEHPLVSGTIATLLVLALFGIVGGIERGSIPFPF